MTRKRYGGFYGGMRRRFQDYVGGLGVDGDIYAWVANRTEGLDRGQLWKWFTPDDADAASDKIPSIVPAELHRAGIMDARYLLLGEGEPEIIPSDADLARIQRLAKEIVSELDGRP